MPAGAGGRTQTGDGNEMDREALAMLDDACLLAQCFRVNHGRGCRLKEQNERDESINTERPV